MGVQFSTSTPKSKERSKAIANRIHTPRRTPKKGGTRKRFKNKTFSKLYGFKY
jgi:hypothetical protein